MIDIRTVLISYVISNAICLAVMASLWVQNGRRFNGLGFFLVDYIFQFVALLLVALRGWVPDFLSMVVSNAMVIGGTMLLLAGLERLTGKRSRQLHNALLLVGFILVHLYFVYIQPDLTARNILLSAGLLVVCSQCAWLMLRRVDAGIPPLGRGVGIIFLLYVLTSLVRMVVDLLVPVGNDFLRSNVYDTLVILIYQMLFIALTFSLSIMINRCLFTSLEGEISKQKNTEQALRFSEEMFSKAFETSPDAIVISRLHDGKILDVNHGFTRLTGYTRAEALANTSIALNLWVNLKDRKASVTAVQKGQAVRDREYCFRTKSGKILRCLYSGEIVQLDGDNHLISVVRDITERKQAEEIMRVDAQRHGTILQTAMSGFWQVAADGRLLEVNRAYCEMSGYSEQELLTMSISDLDATESPERIAAHMQEIMRAGSDRFEARHRRKDGSIMDVEVSVQYQSRYFFAFLRDITEEKRSQTALAISEQRYRFLFENLLDGYAYCRMFVKSGQPEDYIFLNVNKSFEELTGLKGVVGKRVTELVPGIRTANPELFEIFGRVALGGLPEKFETFMPGLNNWFSISVYCPEPEHFVTLFETITKHKQMEADLRRQTDVMIALHQLTVELINRRNAEEILQTLLNKIGSLLDVSQASIDLLEGEDVLVTYAVTPGQPLRVGDRMRRGEGGWLSWQAVETGLPAILDDYAAWSQRRPLFEGFPIHAIAVIPIYQGQRIIGTLNFSRSEPNQPFDETDIYAARLLVHMVVLILGNAEVYTQLQHELDERVRTEEIALRLATLEERQRLARDLHDSVSQSIHSLGLFAETLVSNLERERTVRAIEIAERLQESARQALKEMRLLLYQLQPASPDQGVDLIQEVELRLASVERRAGVRAQVVVQGSIDDIPDTWKQDLLRITLEALNNSLKYAQAHNVAITIRSLSGNLELEVIDDGIGFDLTRLPVGGIGLRTMRERAEKIGGTLEIFSTPGGGTKVLVCSSFSA